MLLRFDSSFLHTNLVAGEYKMLALNTDTLSGQSFEFISVPNSSGVLFDTP